MRFESKVKMSLSYVAQEREFVYSEIFANRIPYQAREVKRHLATVSKLGIMQKQGQIPFITGSINFGKPIDASKVSLTITRRPTGTKANDSEINITPIPKGAKVNRLEYDYDKVTMQRGKDSYTNADLIFWYKHFTSTEPPRGITRARLEDLHRELEINKSRK